jgi:hypothetical protein
MAEKRHTIAVYPNSDLDASRAFRAHCAALPHLGYCYGATEQDTLDQMAALVDASQSPDQNTIAADYSGGGTFLGVSYRELVELISIRDQATALGLWNDFCKQVNERRKEARIAQLRDELRALEGDSHG